MTDPMQDFMRTTLLQSNAESLRRIGDLYSGLEAEARDFFGHAGTARTACRSCAPPTCATSARSTRFASLCHRAAIDLAELDERFHALHEHAYTYRLDSDIEFVNFHVVASMPTPKPEMQRRPG